MDFTYPTREITEYGKAHPEAFAGQFFNLTGPDPSPLYFNVMFTGGLKKHAREVLALAEYPRNVRFWRAPASRVRIQRTIRKIGKEQIEADPPDPYLGAQVVAIGGFESDNHIRIDLADYNSKAARKLKARYGSRTCVTLGDVSITALRG